MKNPSTKLKWMKNPSTGIHDNDEYDYDVPSAVGQQMP
jgi:hypothetical protein